MLNAVTVNVVILSVFMLNAVKVNVVAPNLVPALSFGRLAPLFVDTLSRKDFHPQLLTSLL